MQATVDLAESNGGMVTTAQVVSTGITRARISDMVKAGELERGQRVVDAQVVKPAMKQYVRSGKKDVQTLLGRLVVRHTVSAGRPLPR